MKDTTTKSEDFHVGVKKSRGSFFLTGPSKRAKPTEEDTAAGNIIII